MRSNGSMHHLPPTPVLLSMPALPCDQRPRGAARRGPSRPLLRPSCPRARACCGAARRARPQQRAPIQRSRDPLTSQVHVLVASERCSARGSEVGPAPRQDGAHGGGAAAHRVPRPYPTLSGSARRQDGAHGGGAAAHGVPRGRPRAGGGAHARRARHLQGHHRAARPRAGHGLAGARPPGRALGLFGAHAAMRWVRLRRRAPARVCGKRGYLLHGPRAGHHHAGARPEPQKTDRMAQDVPWRCCQTAAWGVARLRAALGRCWAPTRTSGARHGSSSRPTSTWPWAAASRRSSPSAPTRRAQRPRQPKQGSNPD